MPSNNFDTMIKVPMIPGFNPTVLVNIALQMTKEMHKLYFLPNHRNHNQACYTTSNTFFRPLDIMPSFVFLYIL